jgi:hypothetical protein
MQTYQTKVMNCLGYVVMGVARSIEATGRAVKLRNVNPKVAGYVGVGVEHWLRDSSTQPAVTSITLKI